MSTSSLQSNPVRYARLGGALYLIIILCGGFAEGFVNSQLLTGSAAATAQRILAAPELWRLGTALNLLVVLCAVPLLWIEFQLLRHVDRGLALLSLMLNAVSLAVEAISKLFQLLVLPLLQNTDYAHAWPPAQVAGLATLALKAHDVAFNIALVFFGFTCLLNGYLIIKSGFLPAVLGVLMQVAGAAYLVGCLAALFAPALAERLIPGVLLPPLVGELSLCLWLLIKGVDATAWRQRGVAASEVRPVMASA